MTPDQPAEKPLRGPGVPPVLKKNIDDISILVDGTPQIPLIALILTKTSSM